MLKSSTQVKLINILDKVLFETSYIFSQRENEMNVHIKAGDFIHLSGILNKKPEIHPTTMQKLMNGILVHGISSSL